MSETFQKQKFWKNDPKYTECQSLYAGEKIP